jgi:hypothetical protein
VFSSQTLRRREEVKENDFPRVLPYYVKPKAPRIERSAGVLFRTQEGTRAAIMNKIDRDSNSKKKTSSEQLKMTRHKNSPNVFT